MLNIFKKFWQFCAAFSRHVTSFKMPKEQVPAPKRDLATQAAALEVLGYTGAIKQMAKGSIASKGLGDSYQPSVFGPRPATPSSNGGTITVVPHINPDPPRLEAPSGDYRPSWQGPRPK